MKLHRSSRTSLVPVREQWRPHASHLRSCLPFLTSTRLDSLDSQGWNRNILREVIMGKPAQRVVVIRVKVVREERGHGGQPTEMGLEL